MPLLAAVSATVRRKLIQCALWTEMCMGLPALVPSPGFGSPAPQRDWARPETVEDVTQIPLTGW
jgi:hypothetical protein